MGCPCGGYPSIRNNELRSITAKLLTEVCHGVTSEPTLQPLTGEQLSYRSANVKDDAHLDVNEKHKPMHAHKYELLAHDGLIFQDLGKPRYIMA